jgi:hypothetical protein
MNDENILIIGDDGAGEQNINESNPSVETTTDASRPVGRDDAFAENFLQAHKTEFREFERREREKLACAEQFRTLETEITNRRQWLEGLQSDLAAYENIDLATDLYKNMQLTGRPLLDIAQSPLFSAAAIIKENGKHVLHLAEKDLADLEKKFEVLKEKKEEVLRELKLV